MVIRLPIWTFLVYFFTILSAFGQTAEDHRRDILRSYGFDKMSIAGQDTMYYYFQHAYEDLYGLEVILGKQKPIPEIKHIFNVFFAEKLSGADLAIVDNLWDQRYVDFKKSTLERSERYCAATRCQQYAIDSLLIAHRDTLLTYKDQVKSNLTDAHLAILSEMYRQSMRALDFKKSQFLDNERQFTLEITPCMYSYMEYGFQLMHDIPCANYYNLLGVNMSDLNFIDSLNLSDYYRAYARFEVELTKILGRPGCKAHLAIPFYVESVSGNTETTFRKRNALLYMLITAFPERLHFAVGESYESLDSVLVSAFAESKLTTAAILDVTILDSLNLEFFPFADEPGVISYLSRDAMTDHSDAMPCMIAFQLLTTIDEKQKRIAQLNHANSLSRLKKITLNELVIYYSLIRDETRDAKRESMEITGVVIGGTEMVSFMWFDSYDKAFEPKLLHLISAIRLPLE